MAFDPDHVVTSPFFVGGIGSLVALKFVPGGTWLERFTYVTCGTLMAGYITPALTEALKLSGEGLANGTAFMVGLLGMSLIDAAIQGVRKLPVSEILQGWLKRG